MTDDEHLPDAGTQGLGGHSLQDAAEEPALAGGAPALVGSSLLQQREQLVTPQQLQRGLELLEGLRSLHEGPVAILGAAHDGGVLDVVKGRWVSHFEAPRARSFFGQGSKVPGAGVPTAERMSLRSTTGHVLKRSATR